MDSWPAPERCRVWGLRRGDPAGTPLEALKLLEVPTPKPGRGEVLVRVMAAGVNYNAVWACLHQPINVFDTHREALHVVGSDGAGVVWATGEGVSGVSPGDEVVIQGGQVACGRCEACVRGALERCDAPMSQGYQTSNGLLAEFALVQAHQLAPKPPHLTWEEAGSYMVSLFTAFHMLVDRAQLAEGDDVLVWGAGGGLGVYALQIARAVGARTAAVVSTPERAALARKLGALGVVDRRELSGLSLNLPGQPNAEAAAAVRLLRQRLGEIFGHGRGPDVVFEHVGQKTFATSVQVAARHARIVFCGATTGHALTFDARHLWIYEKTILGSHSAPLSTSRRAHGWVEEGKIDVVLGDTFAFDEVPRAHQAMLEGRIDGNAVCLIGAPVKGLKRWREVAARLAAG